MLDDIDNAVIDGDETVGRWKDYRIPFANGDVAGNKGILDAADAWMALDTEKEPQSVIWAHRGELFYQIILKLNPDVNEQEIKGMADQKSFDKLISIWSQQ